MGVSVIGIGNRTASDDAVGPLLVRQARRRLEQPGLAFSTWDDADALTVAHDLLSLRDAVLLVDCADMGLDGGECRCFAADRVRLGLHADGVSTHGIGLADALEIARGLGFDRPTRVFGVQPFDCAPGLSLTPEMAARLDTLTDALCDAIDDLRAAVGDMREAP